MPTSETGQMFDISRSNMYHIWLMEKEQVSKNKWYLSEKVGYDVGEHAARLDWNMRFRKKWINELKASGIYPS